MEPSTSADVPRRHRVDPLALLVLLWVLSPEAGVAGALVLTHAPSRIALWAPLWAFAVSGAVTALVVRHRTTRGRVTAVHDAQLVTRERVRVRIVPPAENLHN
jgi:hypothetical protein